MTQHPASQTDLYYMMLAIEQAKKGLYTTRPNPAVGCVIVKDHQIIGQGYHPKAGEPHAEVFALKEAKEKAQGATAYVTLEPCSHTGKTPPCAKALIQAKVARVVIAGLDPNPKVSGNGIAMLKQAGIDVTLGIATHQAEQLNLGFLKSMKTGQPYVKLKLAVSLDGRTAMASGQSKWITSTASRHDVQRLRAQSAAIITGSQTIIDDNPLLTVREDIITDGSRTPHLLIPQPKIVILDRRKRLNTQSPYHVCQRDDTLFWSQNHLKTLLTKLVTDHQCYDILVEAGATIASQFIQQQLVDEIIIYQAPCLLGNTAQPMFTMNLQHIDEQIRLSAASYTPMGTDLKITLKLT